MCFFPAIVARTVDLVASYGLSKLLEIYIENIPSSGAESQIQFATLVVRFENREWHALSRVVTQCRSFRDANYTHNAISLLVKLDE